MRLIAWLLKILIFIALLGFALGNTEPVRVGVFGNQELGFTGPLVVFLLLFFLFGLLMGFLTLMPRLYRGRREASRLKRDLEKLQQIIDSQPAVDADGVVVAETSAARLKAH